MQICCSTFSNWDTWLLKQPGVSFTQSMLWAKILAEEGQSVELLQAVENGVVYAQALTVKNTLPFGFSYLFSPKGPVVSSRAEAVYQAFFDYFKKRDALFWRVEPDEFQMSNVKCQIKQTADVNPRATTMLNIKRTVDELLAGMHQKTRYNINLALKKGVTVREEKNWETFWHLMQMTGKRDGFRLHDKKHYEHIFASALSRQLIAFVDGRPVATAIFVGFGDTFTYLYGASDYEYRQFMAPYVVQWEGIQLGKRLGYVQYDTFGIAPRLRSSSYGGQAGKIPDDEYIYDTKHQYAGVTRFKLGFGGEPVVAPGTFDLLISPWRYKLYQVLRKIRRLF